MSIPIKVWKVLTANGAHPQMSREPENASETALQGTPVLMTSGMVGASTTIDDGDKLILGFTTEPFHNLTTDNTPKTLTYGAVQNQSSAVLIPVGAPPSDGKIGVLIANDDVVFQGKVGDAQSVAITAVGDIYGLTKHSNGFWYVDTSITATASGACVKVVEVIDAAGTVGGKVAFKVLKARQQFSA